MTVKQLRERLQTINLPAEAARIVMVYKDVIEKTNREQLYDGLDANGNYLRPRYSEDPFFKSSEDAQRYAIWKDKITPNPKRPHDVPNLFINGQFHNSRSLRVVGTKMVFESDDHNAPDITRKYKNLDGLTPANAAWFRKTTLQPELILKIAKVTGLRIVQR